MPGYQNGKIYNILNNIDGGIYVGSTIEALGQRMSKHRYSMKNNHIINYTNICMNWM